MKPNALIVGGTSGLGLAMAARLLSQYNVIVTGRRVPDIYGIETKALFLDHSSDHVFDRFVNELPQIDLLVYAAGFYQEGSLSTLRIADIGSMINVGLRTPTILLNFLLNKQSRLDCFVAITSTSQWTPRAEEPLYTAVKAGLGMLANSISNDENVGKVLVAAPAGMKTEFWKGTEKDTTTMNDPGWVAEQIVNQLLGEYSYKFVKILRSPSRVEIAEQR